MSENDQSPVNRALSCYVDVCAARPWTMLILLAAVTALFSLSLPRISLQTTIDALLPEETVSQRSNEEARDRYGGGAPLFLVVESSDPEMNRSVTRAALSEVQKWPETVWAMNARDPSFFLDRRLLFVEESALGEFADDVDAYVGFKKCEKMPGCVQLDDEPSEPDFKRLENELRSQPEIRSLASLFGEGGLEKAVKGSSQDELTGELCSPSGGVCVVQVTLKKEPADLEFSRRMVARGEELLRRLLPENRPKNTVTAVTGAYRDLPLTREALMNDLKRTFGLGVGLMVLVIMLQFRRVRALVLLMVPLSVGSVWALGTFAWISPKLNLISAAGFIILAGLGIDFGLHLLTHYGAERERGCEPVTAVRVTLTHLFSSLSVAGITTAFGFFALTAAAFRGFAQLGLFATIGIFATLAATFLTFPPLVLGVQKVRPREGAFTRAWRLPAYLGSGFSRSKALWITALGLAAFVGSLTLVPKISLLYDLSPLMQQVSHGTNFRDALSGTSRGAVLLLADDEESLESAAAGIRHTFPNGLSAEGSSSQGAKGAPVITLGTFLPGDQEEKLEHIELLSDSASDAMRFGDEEWKKKLMPWLPLLEVEEPMTRKELPQWVLNSLQERDGTLGTVGITYQDYPGHHAGKMLLLSEKLETLRANHPKVRFASSSAVLGEVMPLLRQDGWRVTGLALLGLLVATLLIGRSFRRTSLILSSILIAVTATAALMVVFDWKIDFYNLLVFPVAFGIGVDGAIYVVWTVLRKSKHFDWEDLPTSARAVFGSTLTTFVVFFSLATSENGGLSSLGRVGSMALLVTLVSNLLWLPAALSWLHRRKTEGLSSASSD